MKLTKVKESVAKVETAVSLTEKEKKEIAEFIQKTGFSGDINYSVNPDVLGGIRIIASDWIYDTTLKFQLNKLVRTLS